ncbi:MAG: hypothetical protein K5989_10730 [Lachnospiraceae bacterium]|nr:hypothetical protein [Lachnospiraceae bacterium]
MRLIEGDFFSKGTKGNRKRYWSKALLACFAILILTMGGSVCVLASETGSSAEQATKSATVIQAEKAAEAARAAAVEAKKIAQEAAARAVQAQAAAAQVMQAPTGTQTVAAKTDPAAQAATTQTAQAATVQVEQVAKSVAVAQTDPAAQAAVEVHVTFISPKGVVMVTAPKGTDMTYMGPTDVGMPGYAFCGWDANLRDVQKDMSVNAVYRPMGGGTETAQICTTYQTLPTGILNYTHVNNDTLPKATTELQAAPTQMGTPCTMTAQEVIKTNPVGIPGQTCVVKWYNGSTGELWKADVVAYGTTLPQPDNPCINGLEFTGWDGSWTNITEDRNIVAGFYKEYHVKYICEVCQESMKDVRIRVGDPVPPYSGQVHVHSHHNFKGWYDEPKLQADGYTIYVLSDYTDVDREEDYLGD